MEVLPIIENTSPWIWRTNQWTGFYMIGISVMKELIFYHTQNLLVIHFVSPVSFLPEGPQLY